MRREEENNEEYRYRVENNADVPRLTFSVKLGCKFWENKQVVQQSADRAKQRMDDVMASSATTINFPFVISTSLHDPFEITLAKENGDENGKNSSI